MSNLRSGFQDAHRRPRRAGVKDCPPDFFFRGGMYMNTLLKTGVVIALVGAMGAAGAAEPVAVQGAATSQQQASIVSPRDAASGQASGKRQHKPVLTVTDEDGDAGSDARVKSPRDAPSGQASGKRTTAPAVAPGGDTDDDCDGTADDRVAASSRATAVAADGTPPACAQKTTSPLYEDKGREVRSPLYTGSK